MKIGLYLNRFAWPDRSATIPKMLKGIAGAADQSGFYSFWLMDHLFQLEPALGPASDPMLEPYSALSYVAAHTDRIKLGAMVTGVVYRNPGFLLKQVTGLDVLSNGRAYMGLGAAWFEREAVGYGYDFPPLKIRFEMMEDTLQAAHQMWSGDASEFKGKQFHMKELICGPMPVSQPRPPILIGGMGEKKTLKLVAKYADASNLTADHDLDTYRHKLKVLKRHCDDVGRDYDEIEKTTTCRIHLGGGGMSPAEVIAFCKQLSDLGITHAVFEFPDVQHITPIERFGKEIIPEVSGL